MKGAKGPPSEEEQAAEGGSLTPGMAALLRPGNGEPKAIHQGEEPQPPPVPLETLRRRRWLRTSLWLADVLLVALAARLVFQRGGAFGFMEALLCVVAVVLGAWLSCLALWSD
jgi:hypothetical protein